MAHPKALKDSISYSQALRIKGICLETPKVIKYLNDLKDASIKSGYHFEILDHHFEIAMNVDWKILLENKQKPPTEGSLSLVYSYNKISKTNIKISKYQKRYK